MFLTFFFYFFRIFYFKKRCQKQSMNMQKSSEKQLTADLGTVHDNYDNVIWTFLFKTSFHFIGGH